ncbi:MAG: formylglycine-generating enzyme family protein, partial [Candidatus Omnitrophica bacterium]|nr:formylglycine-generating enzyme family protein [Candidatus Omnitrophota bacterium]
YPIFNVSWSDCQAFAAALTSLGRGTFRLPTEAEWEYACRAGSTTRFYFGNSLFCADECENCDTAKGTIFIERRLDFMWFCAGQNSAVHRPVATLFPNLFGLYDMHGNVSEWCQDSYHENYEGAPTDGSAWVSFESTRKAIRGGDSVDSADECRSASRSGASTNPFIGDRYIGLRVVRVQ